MTGQIRYVCNILLILKRHELLAKTPRLDDLAYSDVFTTKPTGVLICIVGAFGI